MNVFQHTEVSLGKPIQPMHRAIKVKGKWVSPYAPGAVRERRKQSLAWIISQRPEKIEEIAAQMVQRGAQYTVSLAQAKVRDERDHYKAISHELYRKIEGVVACLDDLLTTSDQACLVMSLTRFLNDNRERLKLHG